MPENFDNFKFDVKTNSIAETTYGTTKHIAQEIYYIDRACRRNGKPNCRSVWTVVAEYDRDLKACGFIIEQPSNQTAEVSAAIEACKIAHQRNQNVITIVTDSRYLHTAATELIDKWSNNDWKDHCNKLVVNARLFKELLYVKKGLKIEWIHVKGHSDNEGNNRADALANSLLDKTNEEIAYSILETNNKF